MAEREPVVFAEPDFEGYDIQFHRGIRFGGEPGEVTWQADIGINRRLDSGRLGKPKRLVTMVHIGPGETTKPSDLLRQIADAFDQGTLGFTEEGPDA